jgi:pimeloyl-ACP methyl ester carboxylesterase
MIAYYRTMLRIMAALSPKAAAKSAFRLYCTPLRRSAGKEPSVFKEGSSFEMDVQGHRVYGHRWNETAKKKILIIHGFESSSKNFERYVSLLTRKNFQVVTFDAPAHGRSSGKQITLPLYLTTVNHINDLYGPFDGFVSHSFGGLTLSHFLEGSGSGPDTRAVLIAPATETSSTVDSFFQFLHLSDAIRPAFDKLIYELGGQWPEYYSVRRALHQVKARVLWLHDEDDELTPFADAVKVLEDNHPNVTFRITKGLGHRRIYRDNEVLKEVVDFFGPDA